MVLGRERSASRDQNVPTDRGTNGRRCSILPNPKVFLNLYICIRTHTHIYKDLTRIYRPVSQGVFATLSMDGWSGNLNMSCLNLRFVSPSYRNVQHFAVCNLHPFWIFGFTWTENLACPWTVGCVWYRVTWYCRQHLNFITKLWNQGEHLFRALPLFFSENGYNVGSSIGPPKSFSSLPLQRTFCQGFEALSYHYLPFLIFSVEFRQRYWRELLQTAGFSLNSLLSYKANIPYGDFIFICVLRLQLCCRLFWNYIECTLWLEK